MIRAPLNDRACLDKLTLLAIRAVARKDIAELATRFCDTNALAGWIRQLPQRDDRGSLGDGPTVSCDVPQRARVMASDPNCVERSLLYIAVAENVDPLPSRQLATIETRAGRHTLVVEDGEPVVLDPQFIRNCAGRTRRACPSDGRRNGFSLPIDVHQLIDWVQGMARKPAQDREGDQGQMRVTRAGQNLKAVADGAPVGAVRSAPGAAEDIDFMLDAASTVAPFFGPAGTGGVELARTALGMLGLLPKKPPPAPAKPNEAAPAKEPETKG